MKIYRPCFDETTFPFFTLNPCCWNNTKKVMFQAMEKNRSLQSYSAVISNLYWRCKFLTLIYWEDYGTLDWTKYCLHAKERRNYSFFVSCQYNSSNLKTKVFSTHQEVKDTLGENCFKKFLSRIFHVFLLAILCFCFDFGQLFSRIGIRCLWSIPGMSKVWPLGQMRPAIKFCLACMAWFIKWIEYTPRPVL